MPLDGPQCASGKTSGREKLVDSLGFTKKYTVTHRLFLYVKKGDQLGNTPRLHII